MMQDNTAANDGTVAYESDQTTWYNEATWRFVYQHQHEEVTQLALHAKPDPQVDFHAALQQIDGWQRAQHKLPRWAKREHIVFPVKLSMEQCSSEQTATYKQQVLASLLQILPATDTVPHTLVDLTGGFGVDCTLLAPLFDHVTMVEHNPELAYIVQHNMRVFGLGHVQVQCDDAQRVLDRINDAHQQVTCIMIDPARRDQSGSRTYAIADCTPNVLTMLPSMLNAAPIVMIKLSPMLDWHKAVDDITDGVVQDVHIVAVQRECKELLIVVVRPEIAAYLAQQHMLPTLHIAHILGSNTILDEIAFTDARFQQYAIDSDGTNNAVQYFDTDTVTDTMPIDLTWLEEHQGAAYVYEPHAAMMKAGCFDYLEHRYGVTQLAPNSHLYIATRIIPDFPGKCMSVAGVSSANKKQLRVLVQGLSHANISVRNFPQSVATLRKTLRLADGGDTTLYATSLSDRTHVVLRTQPAER